MTRAIPERAESAIHLMKTRHFFREAKMKSNGCKKWAKRYTHRMLRRIVSRDTREQGKAQS